MCNMHNIEELDGPAVSALRRAIAEIKQRLLSRSPPCLGRRVKPLVPAPFAVDSTHQPTLGPFWVIARSPYV
jgi:hypothetical protein